MQELHISVRNLVEFIFRAGDIDNRAGKLASAEAMMEGSRIHRKIQKSMDTSFLPRVFSCCMKRVFICSIILQ